MFLNCSNHKVENWAEDQRKAAETKYGEIIDYPFPHVSPYADCEEIEEIADCVVNEILEMKPDAVMCQGEFTLSYQIIFRLKEQNVITVAACSDRKTTEVKQDDGSIRKVSEFKFIQFREY